jgi:hypothetical protein
MGSIRGARMEEKVMQYEKKWGESPIKYLENPPEFGSIEYFALFGPPTREQYAAYNAHMCG